MHARLSILLGTTLVGLNCTGEHAHEVATGTTAEEQSSTSELSAAAASASEGSSDGSTSTGDSTMSTSGSTTEPEVPDYEGQHVVVFTDSAVKPCGGTMAHMDDFVQRISERLGVTPPTGDERIRFVWLDDRDEVAERCGLSGPVTGCVNDGRIYSWSLPHNHELVHAVSYGVGHPPPFFTEGLAVAHAGHGGWPVPEHIFFDEGSDVVDLIALSSTALGDTKGGYETAGRFTAYLIDRHGLDRYLELYAALPRGAALEETDLIFQRVLGVSVAESIADFGSPWKDIQSNVDPQLSECGAQEIAWDGQLLTMDAATDCWNDNTIGPYDVGKVEEHYAIEIPADGLYELRIAGDDAEAEYLQDFFDPGFNASFVGVSLLPCGAGTSGYMETKVNGTPRLHELAAGRHSLRLMGIHGVFYSFTFTLKRLPDP